MNFGSSGSGIFRAEVLSFCAPLFPERLFPTCGVLATASVKVTQISDISPNVNNIGVMRGLFVSCL